MPKGTAFDLEVIKAVKAKTVKKESEETLAVWEPETGKRFRLAGFTLYLGTAEAIITLLDEATVIYYAVLAAKGFQTVILPQQGYLSVKTANKLNLKVSVENAVTACFFGVEEVA